MERIVARVKSRVKLATLFKTDQLGGGGWRQLVLSLPANVLGVVLSSPEVRGGQRSVDRRIDFGEIGRRAGEEPAGRTPREKCRDVRMRRVRAYGHARHLAGHARYILDLRS